MIYTNKGDLFDSDCTILIQQCNCQSNMGKGIAEYIANRYPEAKQKDIEFPYSPKERMGKFSFAYNQKEKRYIFNLYAQLYPGKTKTMEEQEERYVHFKEGMYRIMYYLIALEEKIEKKGLDFTIKIGIPHGIASNLAGGDWNRIYTILEEVSQETQTDIYIYQK